MRGPVKHQFIRSAFVFASCAYLYCILTTTAHKTLFSNDIFQLVHKARYPFVDRYNRDELDFEEVMMEVEKEMTEMEIEKKRS